MLNGNRTVDDMRSKVMQANRQMLGSGTSLVISRNLNTTTIILEGFTNNLGNGMEHLDILCVMDTGNGAAFVHRSDKGGKMIPLPIIGHWMKKMWGWYRRRVNVIGELLVATRNGHKTEEIAAVFGKRLEVRDLSAVSGVPEVEETGETFLENARLKAVEVSSAPRTLS